MSLENRQKDGQTEKERKSAIRHKNNSLTYEDDIGINREREVYVRKRRECMW